MDVPYPMPFSSKSDRKVKEVKKSLDPELLEFSQALAVMSELLSTKKATDKLSEEEETQLQEKVEAIRSQLAAMGFELQIGSEADFEVPEGSVPTFALKKIDYSADNGDGSSKPRTKKGTPASKL
jgi:hypothetical protein